MISVTETIQLDDREVQERFVRATGPGGQNARKEATAVELSFNIRASALPAEIKERLTLLARRHLRSDGALVIVSRNHRSQVINREAAYDLLLELLRRAVVPSVVRRKTRPDAGEREERLASKHKRADLKRSRLRAATTS
jgi:ribosome-associated protein